MKCTICNSTFEEAKTVTIDHKKMCISCARTYMSGAAPDINMHEKKEPFGFMRCIKLAALSFIPIFPWGLNYLYIGKYKISLILILLYIGFNALTLAFLGNLILTIFLAAPIRFVTFIHALSISKSYKPRFVKTFEEMFMVYLLSIFAVTFLNFTVFRIFPSDVNAHLSGMVDALFLLVVVIRASNRKKDAPPNIVEGSYREKTEETKQDDKAYEVNEDETREEILLANKLRSYTLSLQNAKLHRSIVTLSQTTDKIVNFIIENPKKRRNLNKFFEYLLPTTIELLEKYTVLLKQGMALENINSSKESIENLMKDLEMSFLKQFDSLFEEKKMNIDAEITVMKNIMERDGIS